MVLCTEETFPAVQIEHDVFEPDDGNRGELLEFMNSLVGRTSSLGAHWWLGNKVLWLKTTLWATRFAEDIFIEQLSRLVAVAHLRTPEIVARFGPTSRETWQ